MYGIDNITANNGWAMAAVGSTIVFLGLVALSFVISQIHNLLEFWEKRSEAKEAQKAESPSIETPKPKGPVYKVPQLPTVNDLISIYRPLAEQLKEPFELPQLFEISNKIAEKDISLVWIISRFLCIWGHWIRYACRCGG